MRLCRKRERGRAKEEGAEELDKKRKHQHDAEEEYGETKARVAALSASDCSGSRVSHAARAAVGGYSQNTANGLQNVDASSQSAVAAASARHFGGSGLGTAVATSHCTA